MQKCSVRTVYWVLIRFDATVFSNKQFKTISLLISRYLMFKNIVYQKCDVLHYFFCKSQKETFLRMFTLLSSIQCNKWGL